MNSVSTVDINMTDYIEEAINFFPKEIKKRVSSCATRNTFNVWVD